MLVQPGALTCTSSGEWRQLSARQTRHPSMTGSPPLWSACLRGDRPDGSLHMARVLRDVVHRLMHAHTLHILYGVLTIVSRDWSRCFTDGQFEQAIGIALESRRLDKLEEAVRRAADAAATLDYALQVCQRMVINRQFRQQVTHS
jgi:hypothetical protein